MTTKSEAARAAVERLANVQMNISLSEWSELSSTILAALVPAPATAPAPAEMVEALLAAYDAETDRIPVGHENICLGASSYGWRKAVTKQLRALHATMALAPPAAPAARLGEMIYRALYEHEGGLWGAVDDRYKETVWNAAGRRLAAALAAPASAKVEAGR